MKQHEPSGFDAIGAVPVCATCGSERVVVDAWVCWNREAGLWELEAQSDQAHCQACDSATILKWTRPTNSQNRRIRELNDAFRTSGQGTGTVLITHGVSEFGPEFVREAVARVQAFDTFTNDNDPWGEHDFGAFELGDQKLFWKIDPYNLEQRQHSPNAANAGVTHRVLTIMLASEY